MKNETNHRAFRAVEIPSTGRADEYERGMMQTISETDVGEFVDIIGTMFPEEIGPAMNIYEDQAEDVNDVVQEYIDVTGKLILQYAQAMADADRELVRRLNSIV